MKARTQSVEYYLSVLGVDDNVTLKELRSKYRSLSLKYHPDRNQGDKASSDKFTEINQAYEAILDILKKNKKIKVSEVEPNGESRSQSFYEGFTIRISLDSFLNSTSYVIPNTSIGNISVRLPDYITNFLMIEVIKDNKVYNIPIDIKFTDKTIVFDNKEFKYGIISGMACTVLYDDYAYKQVSKGIATTPYGMKGINTKVIKGKDHYVITGLGLLVQDPMGRVLNSLLIISKEQK